MWPRVLPAVHSPIRGLFSERQSPQLLLQRLLLHVGQAAERVAAAHGSLLRARSGLRVTPVRSERGRATAEAPSRRRASAVRRLGVHAGRSSVSRPALDPRLSAPACDGTQMPVALERGGLKCLRR